MLAPDAIVGLLVLSSTFEDAIDVGFVQACLRNRDRWNRSSSLIRSSGGVIPLKWHVIPLKWHVQTKSIVQSYRLRSIIFSQAWVSDNRLSSIRCDAETRWLKHVVFLRRIRTAPARLENKVVSVGKVVSVFRISDSARTEERSLGRAGSVEKD